MTAEQRAERIKLQHHAQAKIRGPRNQQWLDRLAESNRARWQKGIAAPQEPRVCWGCRITFQPNSGNHFYCTKECQATSRRCTKYGITMDDYMAMLTRQDRKCALCREPWRGWGNGQLVTDHCHKTGKVRGLLCGDCNTALGRFGDDPEKLRAAIAYLEGVVKDEEAAA